MSYKIEFKNPNMAVLQASLSGFILATVLPILTELIFGHYTPFAYIWTFIGVAFHEVGHLVFGFLVRPLFMVIPPLAFLADPIHYLGGFLFSCIAALGLLAFSLHAHSRIAAGKLSERSKGLAFSFMLIAYVNLYFVNFTVTHLPSVVGEDLDFTTAAQLLNTPLHQLILWMWAIHWITFAAAVLINIFFVFRKRS